MVHAGAWIGGLDLLSISVVGDFGRRPGDVFALRARLALAGVAHAVRRRRRTLSARRARSPPRGEKMSAHRCRPHASPTSTRSSRRATRRPPSDRPRSPTRHASARPSCPRSPATRSCPSRRSRACAPAADAAEPRPGRGAVAAAPRARRRAPPSGPLPPRPPPSALSPRTGASDLGSPQSPQSPRSDRIGEIISPRDLGRRKKLFERHALVDDILYGRDLSGRAVADAPEESPRAHGRRNLFDASRADLSPVTWLADAAASGDGEAPRGEQRERLVEIARAPSACGCRADSVIGIGNYIRRRYVSAFVAHRRAA